jgi:hypothetical protein
MEANVAVWNSHVWNDRLIEIEPGLPLIQHACRPCGRNFVDERLTDNRYAVHVGVARFDRLSDETTAHWLTDVCPGECLLSDNTDRKTRFLALGAIAPVKIAPIEIALPLKRAVSRLRVARRPSPSLELSPMQFAQRKHTPAPASRTAV